MTDTNIRYERIKVKDLVEFAQGIIQRAAPGQFVPITMQRARAHANNPYANPEDVALLVAIDGEGDVVGYFGILPLLLRREGQLHPCHWFTTWSVSAKVRGLGVGTELMREALKLRKDFLIVGSIHARRVCQKFGFWERPPLHYYWIDPSGTAAFNPLTLILRLFRKFTHILRLKTEIRISTRTTQALDHFLSPLGRLIFYPLLSMKLSKILKDTQYQRVSEIRQELPEGIIQPHIELHRGVEAVNWMLAFPWVLETGNSPTEDKDYYFSDTRPRHEFIVVELLQSITGSYRGFVIFSLSQKGDATVIKTLDYAITDPQQYQQILALAVHYGRQHNAVTIEVPEEIVHPLQSTLIGQFVLQKKTRIYQCHPASEDSSLAKSWENIELHLYDGDMAFS